MDTSLFRTTMKTMGIMVGACVAFTGALTLLALLVVGRAVGPSESSHDAPSTIPASRLDGQKPPSSSDEGPTKPASKKADLPPRATRAI